jgi:predicted Zn-dependent protease
MAIVGTLLGVGAVAAAAASNTPEIGQAGMGIASGAGEFARRGLLGYQRTEEATADRSAIRYLEATGQSAKGMIKTFQRFQSALSLSGANVDPIRSAILRRAIASPTWKHWRRKVRIMTSWTRPRSSGATT